MLILRVDDCGWNPPDKANDAGLRYFQEWRNAFGIAGLPVQYGFIPTTAFEELDWLYKNLTARERLAVHGWDHVEGARVTAQQMAGARAAFDASTYIAPWNRYTDQTVKDWAAAGGRYFLGGFPGQDHVLGSVPVPCNGVMHIPVQRALYDRAEPLLKELPKWERVQCPLVVALHATWDANNLKALGPLREYLADKLDDIEAVDAWHRRAALNLEELTAPHYFAYRWILATIRPFAKVLDFGSRYSVLPAKLALRGCEVVAFDRDPETPNYQARICQRLGAKLKAIVGGSGEMIDAQFTPPGLDTIIACWSLQHNDPAMQALLARGAYEFLPPGGDFLIVQSYTPGEIIHQTDRVDPQWILNEEGYRKWIIEPSGMAEVSRQFFHYEHGTNKGREATAQDANAICLHLRKKA